MRALELIALFLPVVLPVAAGGQLRHNRADDEVNDVLGVKDSFHLPDAKNKQRHLESPRGLSGFRTLMIAGTRNGKFKSSMLQGESKTAYNRQCKLELSKDGDLATYKLIGGKYEMTWRSGGQGKGGKYATTLQRDGNIVTTDIETGESVWSTMSHDPNGMLEGAKYYLFFEEGGFVNDESKMLCHLTVWKFKKGNPEPDEDGYYTGDSFERWWTNIHSIHSELPDRGALEPMDYVLQRGEIQSGGKFSMILGLDCKLAVFKGADLSDMGRTVWTADASTDSVDDCHLFARRKDPSDPDDEGEIVLYKGPYKRGIQNGYEDHGGRLWDRKAVGREEDGYYAVAVTRNGPEAHS